MSNNWSWIDIRPEELVVNATRLNTSFWSSLLSRREDLRKILPKRADKVTGADMFNLLYQWNPKVKDLTDSPDPALSGWLQRALETDQIQSLRERTVGDKHIAAASAVNLYRELMRPRESQLKVIVQTKDNLDTLQAMSGFDKDNPVVDRLKQLQEQMAQDNEQLTDEQLIGNLVAASENVHKDLDTAEEMAGIKGYSMNLQDFSERVMANMLNESLVERVTKNDKVRKIVEYLGKMKPLLDVAKSQTLKPQPTPVDLVYGRDLTNIVGSELATLSDPELEDLFYLKYHEGQLLQYEHRDKPSEGRGPFIGVIDASGSMRGAAEQYSLALFCAMARLAIKDNREVGLVYFADNASEMYEVTDGESLITALNASPRIGGGTNFVRGLEKAKSCITSGKISKQSDILFMTDGYSRVDNGFIKRYGDWKKEQGISLVGISIGGYWPDNFVPLMDASATMGSSGEMGKLEWLNQIKDRLVK